VATRMIEVLNPTASTMAVEMEIAPRVNDLNGKVIGLLNNGKPNFAIFLSRVEELLSQRFKFAEVVHVDKALAGGGVAAPLPSGAMEEFAAKCEVVVNGMCD